jgi:signal transduction histidine kinase
VSGVQSIAENKKLLMTVEVPDSLPPLQGDRDRLIQVITNILSNAIKFTLEHGKIGITARQELFPEDRIIVSISDTGIGIPPGETELIFEKFRRSGDVLTNSSPGTGLGLAITRQIVEYHGGTIRAESRLGEGSTFTFTLPLGKQWTGGNEQAVLDSF